MSICIRYKHDQEEANQILNQGFLKVLQNLDRYRTEVPFEAWIRRVMINTVIDEYRKNKKNEDVIEYTDLQDSSYLNLQFDLNEADRMFDAEELQQMLCKLPPISGQVFNLFAIDGYSHKEIGEMLGISDGTSKWHVAFARVKLKEMIERKYNITNQAANQ